MKKTIWSIALALGILSPGAQAGNGTFCERSLQLLRVGAIQRHGCGTSQYSNRLHRG